MPLLSKAQDCMQTTTPRQPRYELRVSFFSFLGLPFHSILLFGDLTRLFPFLGHAASVDLFANTRSNPVVGLVVGQPALTTTLIKCSQTFRVDRVPTQSEHVESCLWPFLSQISRLYLTLARCDCAYLAFRLINGAFLPYFIYNRLPVFSLCCGSIIFCLAYFSPSPLIVSFWDFPNSRYVFPFLLLFLRLATTQ